ncbi:MAG TPA: cyclic nucleotide-binding domain-containing protein [Gaiellaceae bacterium]|nr:cyclic nucleotide-binding domain-containing protein [Gaiellaceae bacterium]
MAGAPLEVLKRVPLLADLDRRELQQVAKLFKERSFPPGETVMKEGLGGAAFFVIESGEAIVSIGGNERRRLGPGDYFGEIALIDEGARTATVTAATELACYGLTLWEFGPVVRENGEIGWKLLQALAAKFRDVAQDA